MQRGAFIVEFRPYCWIAIARRPYSGRRVSQVPGDDTCARDTDVLTREIQPPGPFGSVNPSVARIDHISAWTPPVILREFARNLFIRARAARCSCRGVVRSKMHASAARSCDAYISLHRRLGTRNKSLAREGTFAYKRKMSPQPAIINGA